MTSTKPSKGNSGELECNGPLCPKFVGDFSQGRRKSTSKLKYSFYNIKCDTVPFSSPCCCEAFRRSFGGFPAAQVRGVGVYAAALYVHRCARQCGWAASAARCTVASDALTWRGGRQRRAKNKRAIPCIALDRRRKWRHLLLPLPHFRILKLEF